MSKRRIVLVHGWGGGAVKLEPLEKEMQKSGWETLNMKLPGFDLPDPGKSWGVPEYTAYVFDHLPEEWKKQGYVFFGHSFGGRIGIYAGAEKSAGLEGLVLCAPGGMMEENSVRLYMFKTLARWGKKITGGNIFFKKVLYKIAGAGDYARADTVMKSVMQNVVKFDLWPYAEKISVKTLVLWGDEDRVVPISGGMKLTKILGEFGKMEVCPGQGHLLPYNRPEWVAERINKWTE